jgi:uncharacterized protein YifE (UPF0438 family)
LCYYDAEHRDDDRIETLAALFLTMQSGDKDTTFREMRREVAEMLRPPVDADEKSERKRSAKAERIKRRKRQMVANAKVAKEHGKQLDRQMERPGIP